MTSHNSTLSAAIRSSSLVRVVRGRFEDKSTALIGVPVAIGKQWVLLARLDDAIRFDGFDALRIRDLTEVDRKFARRSFYVKALNAKRCRITRVPHLDLADARSTIATVQAAYPLVVIDREAGDAAGADVGRALKFSAGSVILRTVSPDARWHREHLRIDLADVTRIGFDGEYEHSLAMVAGIKYSQWS